MRGVERPTLLVAPDTFRGTLTAPAVVQAISAAAEPLGWRVIGRPMADGGEGLVAALGGANRASTVTGPGGAPVSAAWRLDDGTAVIECAAASGLLLAGGAQRNDPVGATSAGTGELVAHAVRAGARRVVVGLGGSACTDGGEGAVRAALHLLEGRRPAELGVELVAACDVSTPFLEAARVFGPQKGATPEQVELLTARLETVAEAYVADLGVDVRHTPGAGAAGGLGGGLLALGARLERGVDLVAAHIGLAQALATADALVTGEGTLDATSWTGKVVGGVLELARAHQRKPGLPTLVLAGQVRPDALPVPAPMSAPGGPDLRIVDLSARYGRQASWERTAWCVGEAVRERLGAPGVTGVT